MFRARQPPLSAGLPALTAPISVAQTNYLLRLTKPSSEDEVRALKGPALTQREAPGLIKNSSLEDFSFFTSSRTLLQPAYCETWGRQPPIPTDPSLKENRHDLVSQWISRTARENSHQGYTKRQASTLIDQLVGGDFSAFRR